MISKHLGHLTPLPVGFRTGLWRYTCLLLLIWMLWHRQANFESKGDMLSPLLNAKFEPRVSGTNPQQTECPLTNRLGYRGSSEELKINSPSLWSASIQPTQPHCRLDDLFEENKHYVITVTSYECHGVSNHRIHDCLFSSTIYLG